MDKEEFMNRQPEQNSGNENKENTNRPAYRRVNVYDGTGRSGNKEEYNNRRAYGDRSYGGNSRRRDGESYFRQRGNNANYNSERNHNPYGGNYSDRRRGYGGSYDESAEYNRGKYSVYMKARMIRTRLESLHERKLVADAMNIVRNRTIPREQVMVLVANIRKAMTRMRNIVCLNVYNMLRRISTQTHL